MCRQLKKYGMDIVGLQETLWFGSHQYTVGDCLVLTSGRPTPTGDEPARRGEGVAVVLRGRCREAFERGGSRWTAVGSRLLSLQVKFVCGRNRSVSCLHFAVAYAPTFVRPREEKTQFYADVQSFIDSIPRNDQFVLLGDFNARVGSAGADGDWSSVRGPHGFGRMNSAGEDLLNFLSRNGALICNTCFRKNDVHKHTWFHPRYKQPHCIDYCIIPQSRRSQCIDCQVIRSAECDTDHKFLAMKLRLAENPCFHRTRAVIRKPIAVSKLLCKPGGDDEPDTRKVFRGMLDAELEGAWSHEPSLDDWWTTIKTTTIKVAEDCLGRESRRQPEWFRDSQAELEPFLLERDRLFAVWVSTRKVSDCNAYKCARSSARREVRRVKRGWLLNKAQDCKRFSLTSKGGWECIRHIQAAFQGLKPKVTTAIKNSMGQVCDTPEATNMRWREHFGRVLNIVSDFDVETLDSIDQRPVLGELADVPDRVEIRKAMQALKNGKACGSSEVFAEMLKYGGPVLLGKLQALLEEVWRAGRVPQDWVDAILVPIPKKGDLSLTDNWRGIALLDVVGKLAARLIADRLQRVGEQYLPDSQCGFRRGRGCSDMVFSVRQVAEKLHEHSSKGFAVFIDLRKAYDSVPRAALWRVLAKLGVPEVLVSVIRSFHVDMSASIRIGGELLEPIAVGNGLRQGCTMAPILFNLYMLAVVEKWHEAIAGDDEIGLSICQFRQDRLFNTRLRAYTRAPLTECQFADDSALLAKTHPGAERALAGFETTASAFGLKVNMAKTKFMAIGTGVVNEDMAPLNGTVEHVHSFRYLGCHVTPDARCTYDVSRRIAAASGAFHSLKDAVFYNSDFTIGIKRVVYGVTVLAVLLYGSETWTTRQRDLQRLDVFHHQCLRMILHIGRARQIDGHISNLQVRKWWGDLEQPADKIRRRRLQWLGHMARMPRGDRIPRQLLFGSLPSKRPPHGPRKRWKDVVRTDLAAIGIEPNSWLDVASNRREWKSQCLDGVDRIVLARQEPVDKPLLCGVCNRSFRRRQDIARHRCTSRRSIAIITRGNAPSRQSLGPGAASRRQR